MKILWRSIKYVLKTFFNSLTFIRELILNLILIIALIILLLPFFKIIHFNKKINNVPRALKIDLEGFLSDDFSKYQSEGISNNFISKKQIIKENNSFYTIVSKIRQAANDKNITGIVLDLKNFAGGSRNNIDYIGKALCEFKKTGKKIYGIGKNFTQSQYYLNSFANKIFLCNNGSVNLTGFHYSEFYYKKLLNNLYIHSDIFRIGKYKSAVEPMIRNHISNHIKKIKQNWMNYLWKSYVLTIAKNRNTSYRTIFPTEKQYIKEFKELNCNMTIYAKKHKLVDEILSPLDIEIKLIRLFGFNKKEIDYNSISIYDYLLKKNHKNKTNKIAVISAKGAITSSTKNNKNNIDTFSLIKEIYKAKKDDNVKALILRINSPGGGVYSSELIRKSLISFKKSGKPLIISMGSMTASGGYWISTAGDYLIAHPTTLTGSIGIFSIITNIETSLKKIGIFNNSVQTSSLYNKNYTHHLSPNIKKLHQINLIHHYNQFLKIVALSRHKTTEEVNKIGEGRIWGGILAKKIGLVDEIGDFDSAIKKAAELSHLKNYSLDIKKTKIHIWKNLSKSFNQYTSKMFLNSLNSYLPELIIEKKFFDLYNKIKATFPLLYINGMQDPDDCYAICLYFNNIDV
ncbi:signal peptide peptidase SppA [Buchnera aphidicola (Kurisakia onigurumii)]|uniref:signal peptide peptidase SppA n=1 Tax=Buchnera aphidicola TaxID=9 RepID=UPI0031B6D574